MLKLTQWDNRAEAVYVAPGAICMMMRAAGEKTIIKFGNTSFWVVETPEQILGMPEMLHAMQPPAIIFPEPFPTI